MKKPLFIVFLFSISFSIDAQQRMPLKGRIVADSLNGAAINIVNLSSKTGTTNNTSGEFEIEVKVTDTLLFSSVQYEIREVIISEEILSESLLSVPLIDRVNQLEEVSISNISLSGDLNNDLADIPVFDQGAVGFKLPNKPKPTLIQRKISSAAGSPLLYLINTLNGRLKMLKKAQAIMDYENWIDVGLDVLPPEFFTDELNIPKEKIRQFVYYCAEDPSFVDLLKKGDALEIIDHYLGKAAAFQELHSNLN